MSLDNRLERVVQVVNRAGMHARPAAEFVKTAGRFEADVSIEKDGLEVDGKSILGVLSLAAAKGTDIKIITKGEGAEQAMTEIDELIESGFGEGVL